MAENQIAIYNGGVIKAYLTKADCLSVSIENRQNDESVLTLSMDNNHSKYKYVLEETAVFRCDEKEYIHSLVDDGIKITHNNNSTTSTFTLVESHYRLGKQYVTAFNSTTNTYIDSNIVIILSASNEPLIVNGTEVTTTYAKGSAGYALTALLYGSGWTVGTVDVTGTQDLETNKKPILENIKEIVKLWGGILVIDSINKTISLRNEDTYKPYYNFKIKTGINAKVIEKCISNDIVTKAFIYGKDNLSIKSVNNDLEYITNFSYTSTLYEDILTNNDISDATQLIEWGRKEIDKKCRRRSNIRAEFIDTSCFDNSGTFSTNDIIDVEDNEINVVYQARVIYKKYDFFAPYNCTVEVGDNLKNYDDVLNNVIRTTKVVNNLIATNNTISSSSILTPDKSDVTTILANNQSAINQNAEEIKLTVSSVQTAQSTADSKRKVFIETPTVPYDIGDLWSQGTGGDLMVCIVARTTGSYNSTDWQKSTKYTDDTAINNLQIGGRNLLQNSRYNFIPSGNKGSYTISELVNDTVHGTVLHTNAYSIFDLYKTKINREYLKAGDIVTVSVFVKGTTNTTLRAKINDNVNTFTGNFYFDITNEWKLVTQTVTLTGTPTSNLYLYLYCNGTTEIWLKTAKVEKGNKSTDWTPAPEDVDANANALVDAVQVGGRNLIYKSIVARTITSTKEFTFSGWTGSFINNTNTLAILKAGETYTLSFDMELITKSTVPTLYSYLCGLSLNSVNTTNDITFTTSELKNVGDISHISKTFICPPLTDQTFIYYTNRYTTNGTTPVGYDTVKFTNLKLEKGNKATDYTPAPEDVEALVNGIQVGGRNLLPTREGTNPVGKFVGTQANIAYYGNIVRGQGNSSANPSYPRVVIYSMVSLVFDLTSQYTISFEVRADAPASRVWRFSSELGQVIYSETASVTTEWQKIVAVFKPTVQPNANAGFQIYCGDTTGDTTSWLELRNVKIEKGNKATDYTPAPEDVDSNIATAQTTANNAQTSANIANSLLADIANDSKLTAVEKQQIQTEWNIITSEKTQIDTQATAYGITTEKANYDTAYTTLNTYITPLLSDLTTTSNIVPATFRANFKDYYDKKQLLLNAILAKAKTLADTAQTTADSKNKIFILTGTVTPTNYKVGDLWVLQSDSIFSGKKTGTTLTAKTASATYNASHWADQITSSAITQAKDMITLDFQNGGLSSSIEFSTNGEAIYNGDLVIYDKPKTDATKKQVFYFDEDTGILKLVGRVEASSGIFGNFYASGDHTWCNGGNGAMHFVSNGWLGLFLQEQVAMEEFNNLDLSFITSNTSGKEYLMFRSFRSSQRDDCYFPPILMESKICFSEKYNIGPRTDKNETDTGLFIENTVGRSYIRIDDATGNLEFWDKSGGTPAPIARIYRNGVIESSKNEGIHTGYTRLGWDGTFAYIKNCTNNEWIGIGNDGLPYVTGFHLVYAPNIRKLVNATTYMEVTTDSGAYGVNWWVSDKKIKDNIKLFNKLYWSKKNKDYLVGLDLINKISLYSFDYKTGEHVDLGIVANELEELNPETIIKVEQPKDSPYYSENDPYIRQPDVAKMIPQLIMAIQEQQSIIEKQQTSIDTLEKRLSELEKKISK